MKIYSEGSLPQKEDGTPVFSQSLINAWCQNPINVYYRYIKGLSPKEAPEHIIRGLWVHECLEEHYKGGIWQEVHNRWSRKVRNTTLRDEIFRTLRGYIYYYGKDDNFEVLATELPLEAKLPCGYAFIGKLDALVKTADGKRLVVDHKTTKRIKPFEKQMVQIQAPMYMWLCQQNGLEVDGFMWDYLLTPGPKPPKFLSGGSRLAVKQPNTDYPTVKEEVERAKYVFGDDFVPHARHKAEVERMLEFHKEVRVGGKHPEATNLYHRRTVPVSDQWVEATVRRVNKTAQDIWAYDWSDEGTIQMSPDAYFATGGDYIDLITSYLMTGSSDMVAIQRYTKSDPMERYKS